MRIELTVAQLRARTTTETRQAPRSSAVTATSTKMSPLPANPKVPDVCGLREAQRAGISMDTVVFAVADAVTDVMMPMEDEFAGVIVAARVFMAYVSTMGNPAQIAWLYMMQNAERLDIARSDSCIWIIVFSTSAKRSVYQRKPSSLTKCSKLSQLLAPRTHMDCVCVLGGGGRIMRVIRETHHSYTINRDS